MPELKIQPSLTLLFDLYTKHHLTRAELIELLVHYPYTRGVHPPDTYDAYIPGTWDELVSLVVSKVITDEEFEYILVRVEQDAKGKGGSGA